MIQILFQVWLQTILIITPTKITIFGFNYVRCCVPTLFYFLRVLQQPNYESLFTHIFREEKQGLEWFTQLVRSSCSYPLQSRILFHNPDAHITKEFHKTILKIYSLFYIPCNSITFFSVFLFTAGHKQLNWFQSLTKGS